VLNFFATRRLIVVAAGRVTEVLAAERINLSAGFVGEGTSAVLTEYLFMYT
jgi:hypothetical protein